MEKGIQVVLKAVNGHSTETTGRQIQDSHKGAEVTWDDRRVTVTYPRTEFGALMAQGLVGATKKNHGFEATLEE